MWCLTSRYYSCPSWKSGACICLKKGRWASLRFLRLGYCMSAAFVMREEKSQELTFISGCISSIMHLVTSVASARSSDKTYYLFPVALWT